MKPQDVSSDWKKCPQKDLEFTGTRWQGSIRDWANWWDERCRYAIGHQSGRPTMPQPARLGAWARSVSQLAGAAGVRSIQKNLRRIEKEIELTPEEKVRWDAVMVPFIEASKAALAKVLLT